MITSSDLFADGRGLFGLLSALSSEDDFPPALDRAILAVPRLLCVPGAVAVAPLLPYLDGLLLQLQDGVMYRGGCVGVRRQSHQSMVVVVHGHLRVMQVPLVRKHHVGLALALV